MGIVIRRATQTDLPILNSLLRQVLEVHHERRPDLFKSGVKKYTDEQLLVILQEEETPVFVAEEAGQVYGYAFCQFKYVCDDNVLRDCKSLYIDDLCVDENSRGKGVGKALFAYVKEFAKAQGCYNLTLNVWACNESAAKFYEKMGLKPQKTQLESIL